MRFILPLFAIPCIALSTGCGGKGKGGAEVIYGEVDGQQLVMDVYQPPTASPAPRPAVILVHGGGWAAGDRKDFGDAARWLAGRGYTAFSVGYRLVKDGRNIWPAQLNDVQRAVRWVRAHAGEYNTDPQRIGAIGGSAGGHLVACLGTMDTLDNSDPALAAFPSRVTCVVDLCGPTDLTEDFRTKVKQGEWCNQVVDNLLGGNRNPARGASPLFHVDGRSAPFLVFHGTKDDIVPLDQSERIVAALKAAGVEAELVKGDYGHGTESAAVLLDLLGKTDQFFKRHLQTAGP